MNDSPCNVCGEEEAALIHWDTALHPDDAADGLHLHKYEPIAKVRRVSCHCGAYMEGSDHCPVCHCEEYERDCGRRPGRINGAVPSVAGRPQRRLVMIGKLGPWAGPLGVISVGHIGPTGLNSKRS